METRGTLGTDELRSPPPQAWTRSPGADQIWTDTALSVDQIVKGKVAPKLTIRQQGGRIRSRVAVALV